MDQPANPKGRYQSLNYQTGCLIGVDTFRALHAGGLALGLAPFGSGIDRSSTVVVFGVPETLEGGAIVRAMYERYGTVIAGARNKLSGRVIRIGTMGWFDVGTILLDLAQLECVLADMGNATVPGAGTVAALTHLRVTADVVDPVYSAAGALAKTPKELA